MYECLCDTAWRLALHLVCVCKFLHCMHVFTALYACFHSTSPNALLSLLKCASGVIHTHTHTHTYICTNTYMRTFWVFLCKMATMIYPYIYIYIYIYIFIPIYIYIYICTHIYENILSIPVQHGNHDLSRIFHWSVHMRLYRSWSEQEKCSFHQSMLARPLCTRVQEPGLELGTEPKRKLGALAHWYTHKCICMRSLIYT